MWKNTHTPKCQKIRRWSIAYKLGQPFWRSNFDYIKMSGQSNNVHTFWPISSPSWKPIPANNFPSVPTGKNLYYIKLITVSLSRIVKKKKKGKQPKCPIWEFPKIQPERLCSNLECSTLGDADRQMQTPRWQGYSHKDMKLHDCRQETGAWTGNAVKLGDLVQHFHANAEVY